jgi:hypothetical protein
LGGLAIAEERKLAVELVASGVLLFAAQPEVPAFVMAGASGWAVND